MESTLADKIISEYKLIPGKVSRKILQAIADNQPVDKNILPDGVTLHQIEQIKLDFLKKFQEMNGSVLPKNLLFYHLVKEKIPEFSWEINVNKNSISSSTNVIIQAPRIKNLRPSLLSLLLGRVNADQDTDLHRKYKCVDALPPAMVQQISIMMKNIEVIYPEEYEMQLIVDWLLKGIHGEALTIFSPVCPDYSVEETGNPHCPYRHTFDRVGGGIGLIAQRILKALPDIVSVLKPYNIKLTIIVGIGDFEALSQDNLERVKLTKEEFLNRCEKSNQAFKAACFVPADVFMMTEIGGGHQVWHDKFNYFKNRLKEYDFGASQLTKEKLLTIVGKRRNLYDRWYGKKSTIEEYIPYVLNQGAEYAVMGGMIATFKKNCLVLGADNDAMAPFYSVQQVLPTLYLKRFYC